MLAYLEFLCGVGLGRHLHDNAESTTSTTTQSKEDVLVLAAVSGNISTVRQDCLQLLDVVHSESEGRGEGTVSTSSNPATGSAYSGTCATHNMETVIVSKLVYTSEALSSSEGNRIAIRR